MSIPKQTPQQQALQQQYLRRFNTPFTAFIPLLEPYTHAQRELSVTHDCKTIVDSLHLTFSYLRHTYFQEPTYLTANMYLSLFNMGLVKNVEKDTELTTSMMATITATLDSLKYLFRQFPSIGIRLNHRYEEETTLGFVMLFMYANGIYLKRIDNRLYTAHILFPISITRGTYKRFFHELHQSESKDEDRITLRRSSRIATIKPIALHYSFIALFHVYKVTSGQPRPVVGKVRDIDYVFDKRRYAFGSTLVL